MSVKKKLPPLIELNEVDSTNNYAMGWIQGKLLPKGHEEPVNGLAVLAYHQTAGRGQRGKTWQSPGGESLSVSILLKPDFPEPTQPFPLLMAIAVATAGVLQRYTGDETCIKWPNDLYWHNRKLGGILMETTVQGNRFNWVVAGIGINVLQKQFPGFLQNPVSIKQITGKNADIKQLALELQEAVVTALAQAAQNPMIYFESYNRLLFGRNKFMKLKQGNRVFETLIGGVDAQGRLMTGADGTATFRFGEVEWML
jgi:BirA family biotin operon repressor/biotin-[acetyl-CoA-carboxylase] ligase